MLSVSCQDGSLKLDKNNLFVSIQSVCVLQDYLAFKKLLVIMPGNGFSCPEGHDQAVKSFSIVSLCTVSVPQLRWRPAG